MRRKVSAIPPNKIHITSNFFINYILELLGPKTDKIFQKQVTIKMNGTL